MDTGTSASASALQLPADLADLPPGPGLSAVLAALDPGRLTGHQLLVVAAAQNRQIAHEQSRLLRTLAELRHASRSGEDQREVVRTEDELPFRAIEIAGSLSWTERHTDRMVEFAALAYERAPALGTALAEGRIDLERVKVFHDLLRGVADLKVVRALVDMALSRAPVQNPANVRARLRRLLAKHEPSSLRRRRLLDQADRFLACRPDSEGLVELYARFCDPASALSAYENVDAIARATRAVGDPLNRNLHQLRNDIAIDLLRGVDPAQAGYAAAAERKGTITLTIDLATLAALDGQPAELAGFGPLVAEVARQTALQVGQNSVWRFAVTDEGRLVAEGKLPASIAADAVQTLQRYAADAAAGLNGRARRLPTTAQAAFVRARDKTCVATGCRVPAHRCQIDHRIAWADGGPTYIENLYCLCGRHHKAKHEGGLTYRPTINGMEWTTTLGHRHLQPPQESDSPTTIDIVEHIGRQRRRHLRRRLADRHRRTHRCYQPTKQLLYGQVLHRLDRKQHEHSP